MSVKGKLSAKRLSSADAEKIKGFLSSFVSLSAVLEKNLLSSQANEKKSTEKNTKVPSSTTAQLLLISSRELIF
jgi:hypothetical protein